MRSAPDPVGLAHTARVFTGGLSHGQPLPDPHASWLTTPPQRVLLTAPQSPLKGHGPQALPLAAASPRGSDRRGARASRPGPLPTTVPTKEL